MEKSSPAAATASPAAAAPRRLRVRVEGVVQGVGFRPHVYRLARELILGGYVLNDERGVLLEVEGEPEAVERFLGRLRAEPPPLARIERVLMETIAATGSTAFEIRPSLHSGTPRALVSPDTATCAECLAEMNDPRDRRYRYPFINCTDCGPRFTIATGVPYDRPLTTMAGFAMCEHCRAEYEDPGDRRYHAQPNACPVCGPRARLLGPDGREPETDGTEHTCAGAQGSECGAGHIHDDAVRAAAQALAEGLVVAVKGIGGYHLACRADAQATVAALRARKHREDRPFALMAPSLAAAEQLVELEADARALLEDRARPIVIAPRRTHARVAEAVAPDCPDLGVMLPYTPLHHLLLADLADAAREAADAANQVDDTPVLVMTSGNVSDEPIAYDDEDAIARLHGIADALLVHDRPIHMRTDDSVLRHTHAGPLTMRRSRGYVPGAIGLPVPATRPLLACGAEQKSTLCVAKQEHAWVSHHIGDLKNVDTLRSFREGVEHFQRLFAVTPEVVVHDLHPDYLSTGYALERAAGDPDAESIEPISVQHHHAHLAACLAEHGEQGPAVGVIFDGSGYGADGTMWGGELLVGELRSCERAGHLRPVRLPGGDRAVYEPWRMACAWLAEAHAGAAAQVGVAAQAEVAAQAGDEAQARNKAQAWEGPPVLPGTLSGEVAPERWETIAQLSRSELAPMTTSMGRLFDAVAALCGVRATVSYEGQAAIELEGRVDPTERGAYPIELTDRDGSLELDPRPAVLAVARECEAGVSLGTIAARMHSGIARATVAAAQRIAAAHELDTVVLSGGVFQNRVLLERTVSGLRGAGLRVLCPRLLPPNDGGISYGQAAVAAARLS